MNAYKVSVIIPMYNVGKYLNECLDSVIKQTLKDIEIILIDDGSTDDTANIANEYLIKYDFVKMFYQENKGQGAARNFGIENAKGDYIYFLDSDDYIAHNSLEILYHISKDYNLDVTLFDGESFSEDYTLNETTKNYYKKKNIYPDLYKGPIILKELIKNNDYSCSPCLLFISRTFIKNNKLKFVEGIIQEDEIFTYKLLKTAQRVKYIKKIFFYRRIRKNSTTTSLNFEKKFTGYYRVFIEMERILIHNNVEIYKEDYDYLKTMLSNSLYYFSLLEKSEKNRNRKQIEILKKKMKRREFNTRLDFRLFLVSPSLYKLTRKLYKKMFLKG